jgi:hypothetical protein
VGTVVRHFKGGRYKVLQHAIDTETKDAVIVYVSLTTGETFTRTAKKFCQEVEWPDGKMRTRFVDDSVFLQNDLDVGAILGKTGVKITSEWAPGTVKRTQRLLGLVLKEGAIPEEVIASWSSEQRIEADKWASAQHLLAVHEPVEEIPALPVHVRDGIKAGREKLTKGLVDTIHEEVARRRAETKARLDAELAELENKNED